MGKINLLGFEIANLIAAGEVVDRPASVVKELLENAVDAGACHITVEIQNGGIRTIRVADDGCGMTAEDLPLSLRRHATSKIREASDLSAITTLGFRGEALAAISSVSTVTILSKVRETAMGTLLTAECGEVTDLLEVGCADGTTVTVENLFHNVPARRKFLKKDVTETQAVSAMVEKVAMSRPDIAVTFVADGTVRFSTVGDGNLQNTLYALLGRDFATRLLPVERKETGVVLSGFIGRSDNARNNRNYQNIFINGRYVKSRTVMAALEQAYTSYIAPEKFPVCAIFLEIDPSTVDVNVHPAKLEVKFSDERRIFETVYYGVRTALENATFRPDLTLTDTKTARKGQELLHRFTPLEGEKVTQEVIWAKDLFSSSSGTFQPSPGLSEQRSSERYEKAVSAPPFLRPAKNLNTAKTSEKPILTPEESAAVLEAFRSAGSRSEPVGRVAASPAGFLQPEVTVSFSDAPEKRATETASDLAAKNMPTPEAPFSEPITEETPYRIIGDVFHCYVLVEWDQDLILIDQHAAHERILFEELLAEQKKDGRVASQELLLPLSVTLSREESAAATEYAGEIRAVGFAFSLHGSEAEITALPMAIGTDTATDLFIEMCDALNSGSGNPAVTAAIRREKALYQIACKGAVKGGRHYDSATIKWLVDRLLSMPDITVCPHGRPVAIRLSKKELDRRFDRIK